MLNRHAAGFDPRDLDAAGLVPVAGPDDLDRARREVGAVMVHPQVIAYIVDVVRATRLSPSLQIGVSPRGATAILRTARAWAWLSGREYVSPDDVKALAFPTLRHRVSLRPEAELEGVTTDSVIESILATVPVPAWCTVILTWRAGLLAAAAVVAVAIAGSWPAALVATGVLVLVVGLDLLLGASPAAVRVRRGGDTSVRLGEEAHTELTADQPRPPRPGLHRPGRLDAVRGRPRRGAAGPDPRPAAAAPDLTLRPTRRGDRRAGPVVIRALGPLRVAGRQAEHDGAVDGPRAAAVLRPQAPAQPAGPAARAGRPGHHPAARAGHRVRQPARVRPRRRRPLHRLAGHRAVHDRGGADLAAGARPPRADRAGLGPDLGRPGR